MSDFELEQRLVAAQKATQAAEEKIQKLIDLVKKARDEEESVIGFCLLISISISNHEFLLLLLQRVPYELRQRYQKARMRKKKAVEEIASLKATMVSSIGLFDRDDFFFG